MTQLIDLLITNFTLLLTVWSVVCLPVNGNFSFLSSRLFLVIFIKKWSDFDNSKCQIFVKQFILACWFWFFKDICIVCLKSSQVNLSVWADNYHFQKFILWIFFQNGLQKFTSLWILLIISIKCFGFQRRFVLLVQIYVHVYMELSTDS